MRTGVTFNQRTGYVLGQGGLRELAIRVEPIVGFSLMAYLAGAEAEPEFRAELEKIGHGVDDEFTPRLTIILELAEVFRSRNAIGRMRAWLREFDNELGTDPASLVRESADASVRSSLRSGAERYVGQLH
jgi:hypothetical protein